MDFNVVVPNLEKRTDRWLTCIGILLGQNTPKSKIIRFLSYDACDYKTFEEAKSAALAMHDTPYFAADTNWRSIPKFCCRWTFYSIIRLIANGSLGECPSLFLIDDMRMTCPYHEISRHINMLSKLERPFRMIQYAFLKAVAPRYCFDRPPVESLPVFQHGIGGPGDWGIVFTPQGARDLLDLIDSDARFAGEYLSNLLWEFGNERNQEGVFSTQKRMVTLVFHPWYSAFQDRTGKTTEHNWHINRNGRIERSRVLDYDPRVSSRRGQG